MRAILIDVGNTKAKYCLVDQGDIKPVSINTVLSELDKVDGIAIASVAENAEVNQVLSRARDLNVNLVSAKVTERAYGVTCAYKNYQNLGIDRWLAILAATELAPDSDLVVVDAGTAMTVDCVNKEGEHLGGWIVPGLNLMIAAIVNKAEKVFTEEQVDVETFGTDTPSAVVNGCLSSCLGTIYHAVSLMEQKTGRKAEIIFTGGDAERLSNLITLPNKIDKLLVFKGLYRFL